MTPATLKAAKYVATNVIEAATDYAAEHQVPMTMDIVRAFMEYHVGQVIEHIKEGGSLDVAAPDVSLH